MQVFLIVFSLLFLNVGFFMTARAFAGVAAAAISVTLRDSTAGDDAAIADIMNSNCDEQGTCFSNAKRKDGVFIAQLKSKNQWFVAEGNGQLQGFVAYKIRKNIPYITMLGVRNKDRKVYTQLAEKAMVQLRNQGYRTCRAEIRSDAGWVNGIIVSHHAKLIETREGGRKIVKVYELDLDEVIQSLKSSP